MAMLRLGRHSRRPYRFYLKGTVAVFLGLCFIVIWSSMASYSVPTQRSSFNGISEPKSETTDKRKMDFGVSGRNNGDLVSADSKGKNGDLGKYSEVQLKGRNGEGTTEAGKKKEKKEITGVERSVNKDGNGFSSVERVGKVNGEAKQDPPKTDQKQGFRPGPVETEIEEPEQERESKGETVDGDGEAGKETEEEAAMGDPTELDTAIEQAEDVNPVPKNSGKKKKKAGPLFDVRKTAYSWKLCRVRSGHNYIPCLDIEGALQRPPNNRHLERSCPKTPPTCLVPLPEGYESPIPWPESKSKIWYNNVAHPKLSSFIKTHGWLRLSGEYLTFPDNETELKSSASQYIDSIEEMEPDIEWGENIRLVLDIGCMDASFGATLLDEEVLTLSLGLNNDQLDLAQLSLERGIPVVIGTLATRRLPFPSGVFDAIHCGGCNIPWLLDGGKLLLEMNRILRPGGYFILSIKHESIEVSEAMSTLATSICWNILAHTTDEVSELGVKIYQRPNSNDMYELRRKNDPPLCKEEENPDAAWYVPMRICLHKVPAAIEQRGTEWPEEWPQRLETFPDWLTNRENLIADTDRWKAIVSQSYLNGLGIEWSKVRNVMDMKAIYGGFAAALASQNVWVMNVVPVNAPDTLSIIYERGLLGIYHDWCESFSSYPRSYDLLHADHLFSRLKNRCKLPLGIVVEMDRILRPGGWAIIRDKLEILDPLQTIFRSLHWEIRMTYAQEKEGIICVQKTMWRP